MRGGRREAMNVLIAGGGTGGHLYPGIAIARKLLEEDGTEVLFVGTERGIEARVLPREGLPVRFIRVGRLKGMKAGAIIKTVLTLPAGVIQSLRLLGRARPDVVIGIGGYASGPVALAAWLRRIPLVIVEPNSYAGMANRMLGRLADKIILSFPATDRQGFFPRAKTVRVGPLVREGISDGDRSAARTQFGLEEGSYTVFVTGGSGGAHAVNMAMKDAASLLADQPGLQVLHQTGEQDRESVRAGYAAAGLRAVVMPYIHDMTAAYAAADLVVSRSGATTVAELAANGKRAVLIPYPFAADNHQEYNARALAELGNADVIVQNDLTPQALASAIKAGAAARGRPGKRLGMDAAGEIVRMCKDYV